ncbi:hypothetical protein DSO57_1016919 [Entomophthora muscae]|uniref:Uncharacterized protein n=1 Tax=Entomophthora muscae TaxID=34485 RepID=A0ACC2STM2_9FUNG|nr:hypothetical protein DSO57_1016919 [Entomophthora muscae]
MDFPSHWFYPSIGREEGIGSGEGAMGWDAKRAHIDPRGKGLLGEELLPPLQGAIGSPEKLTWVGVIVHGADARVWVGKVLDELAGLQARSRAPAAELCCLDNLTLTQLAPDNDPRHPMITSWEQERHGLVGSSRRFTDLSLLGGACQGKDIQRRSLQKGISWPHIANLKLFEIHEVCWTSCPLKQLR